jgi:hypothetical protein
MFYGNDLEKTVREESDVKRKRLILTDLNLFQRFWALAFLSWSHSASATLLEDAIDA